MPDFDFFNFFRWVLGTVVTIYATVVTINWATDWYNFLSQPGQLTTMMTRYLVIHGLRLSFFKFCGDLLICFLLCVIFVMLLHAHSLVFDWGNILSDVSRRTQHPH